jgi:hypothetical protein
MFYYSQKCSLSFTHFIGDYLMKPRKKRKNFVAILEEASIDSDLSSIRGKAFTFSFTRNKVIHSGMTERQTFRIEGIILGTSRIHSKITKGKNRNTTFNLGIKIPEERIEDLILQNIVFRDNKWWTVDNQNLHSSSRYFMGHLQIK